MLSTKYIPVDVVLKKYNKFNFSQLILMLITGDLDAFVFYDVEYKQYKYDSSVSISKYRFDEEDLRLYEYSKRENPATLNAVDFWKLRKEGINRVTQLYNCSESLEEVVRFVARLDFFPLRIGELIFVPMKSIPKQGTKLKFIYFDAAQLDQLNSSNLDTKKKRSKKQSTVKYESEFFEAFSSTLLFLSENNQLNTILDSDGKINFNKLYYQHLLTKFFDDGKDGHKIGQSYNSCYKRYMSLKEQSYNKNK